jgi:hypothetical protein
LGILFDTTRDAPYTVMNQSGKEYPNSTTTRLFHTMKNTDLARFLRLHIVKTGLSYMSQTYPEIHLRVATTSRGVSPEHKIIDIGALASKHPFQLWSTQIKHLRIP